jgi:hypothetical protein
VFERIEKRPEIDDLYSTYIPQALAEAKWADKKQTYLNIDGVDWTRDSMGEGKYWYSFFAPSYEEEVDAMLFFVVEADANGLIENYRIEKEILGDCHGRSNYGNPSSDEEEQMLEGFLDLYKQ